MEKEWMENEAEKRKTVLEKIMENETRKYNELKRKLKKKWMENESGKMNGKLNLKKWMENRNGRNANEDMRFQVKQRWMGCCKR